MANPKPNLQNLRRGNVEGVGRKPDSVKAHLKQILEKHGVKRLEEIVSGKEDGVTPSESLKGIEICAKYTLAEPQILTPELFLKSVARVAVKYLNEEQMEAFTGDLMIEIREVL